MATEGMLGLYVETRSYAATSQFWRSLGYQPVFETGHNSGQWEHPSGGPYVFVNEQHDGELTTHPILRVADSAAFAPQPAPTIAKPFTPEHWGVAEAQLLDPDGRVVSLHAPLPDGTSAPDAEAHHAEKYG